MTATNEPYVWLCVEHLPPDLPIEQRFLVPHNLVTYIGTDIIRDEHNTWGLRKPPELCPLSNSLRIEAFLAGEDNGC